MTGWVTQGDRVAQAVRVGVEPATVERALRVRAVEAHQLRVVGAVAATQQVPAAAFVQRLAAVAQSAVQWRFDMALTVSAVGRLAYRPGLALGNDAVAGAGLEQQVSVRAVALLGQGHVTAVAEARVLSVLYGQA